MITSSDVYEIDHVVLYDYHKLDIRLQEYHKELIEYLVQRGHDVDRKLSNLVVSPLHYAIDICDLDVMYQFLMLEAPVQDVINAIGDTALHLVAKTKLRALINLVLFFLRDTEIQNATNREGLTHLHVACMRNDPKLVIRLLQKGADINARIKTDSIDWPGNTPLHFAVLYGCDKNVELLVRNGADVCAQNGMNQTPVHTALECGYEKIMKILLDAHRNVDANPFDNVGLSHFHIACIQNSEEYAEYFLERQVDVNDPLYSDVTIWSGFTPLHLAVKFNRVSVVEALLRKKANPDVQDSKRQTPLQLACLMDGLRECSLFDSIFREYKNKDYKPYEIIEKFYQYEDHVQIVKLLLRYNCNVNVRDKNKRTALFYAYEKDADIFKVEADFNFLEAKCLTKWLDKKRKRVVNLLLLHGADPNAVDIDGNMLIHLIAGSQLMCYCWQDQAILELLLKYGADVNAAKFDGLTPLHMTVKAERLDLVEVLLKYGADVGIMPLKCTTTPLHCVMDNKNDDILRMLLESGADPDVVDIDGSTLMHLAIKTEKVVAKKKQGYVKLELAGSDTDSDFSNNSDSDSDDDDEEEDMHTFWCIGDHTMGMYDCLFEYNCNLDVLDRFGTCALQTANVNSDIDKVFYLLHNGADINVEDRFKTSPLMYTQTENSLYSDVLAMEEEFSEQFYAFKYHARILDSLGLHLSQNNLRHLDLMDELYQQRYGHADLVQIRLLKQVERERKRMRSTPLDDGSMNVFDVLHCSDEALVRLSQDDGTLASIIRKKKFRRDFRSTGFLIKLRYRKACLIIKANRERAEESA